MTSVRVFVEVGSLVGDRLFARLDCPGGYFADICDTGICFGVDVQMADQAVGGDYAVSLLRWCDACPGGLQKPDGSGGRAGGRTYGRKACFPSGRSRKVRTLSETIESNAWDGIVGKMRFQVSSGRIYLTLGLFILGFIVGRIRLFERMDEFRGRLNRWALLALAGLGLLYVARSYLPPVAWGEVSFIRG